MTTYTLAELAALTPDQATNLDITTITSQDQVNALSPLALAEFSISQLTQLANNISNPPGSDSQFWSAAQVHVLSPGQIAAIASNSSLSASALAALTAEQVAALPDNFIKNISALMMTALTPLGLSGLTPTQCGELPAHAIQIISATQVAALTPEQFAALPLSSSSSLGNDTIGALSPEQIAAIPPGKMSLFLVTGQNQIPLSSSQLDAFTPDQWKWILQEISLGNPPWGPMTTWYSAITVAEIAGMNNAGRANLAQANVATQLTSTQLGLLCPLQVAALTAAQIIWAGSNWGFEAALTATQVALFSPSQAAALVHPESLTISAVAALMPSQIVALTNAGFNWGKISSQFISAMTPSAFAALSPTALTALANGSNSGNAILAAITAAQFSFLSDAQIAALPSFSVGSLANLSGLSFPELMRLLPPQIGALTAAQCGTLSAAQVAILLPIQVAGFADLSFLSASALGAISTKQIAAMAGNYNWTPLITAAKTNAGTGISILLPSAIAALPTNVIRAIASSMYSANASLLTAAQLGALTDAQRKIITTDSSGNPSTTDVAVAFQNAVNNRDVTNLNANVLSLFYATLTVDNITFLKHGQAAGYTVATDRWSSHYENGRAFEWFLNADAITAMSVAQIAALRIEAFNDVALATLNFSQIQAMSNSNLEFTYLSADQLASISPEALAGLSLASLAQLNSDNSWTQQSSLTAQSVIQAQYQADGGSGTKVSGLTYLQLGALSVAQIQALSNNCIAYLSAATIEHLAASTVKAFTPEQIGWMNTAALQTVATDLQNNPSLTNGRVNFFQALNVDQIAQLVVQRPTVFSNWVVEQLSPVAIATLPLNIFENETWKISATEHYDYQTFYAEQWEVTQLNWNGSPLTVPSLIALPTWDTDDRNESTQDIHVASQLTGLLWSALSDTQLTALTEEQRSGMYKLVIQLETQTASNTWGDPKYLGFDRNQNWLYRQTYPSSYSYSPAYNFSTPSTLVLSSLPDYVVATLPAALLAQLSSSQLSTLNANQASCMSPTQIGALGSLDNAVLGVLTGIQLAAVAPALIATLTSSQIALIPAQSMDSLTTAQLAQITTSAAGLTSQQVLALSPAQLGNLGDPTQLSPQAMHTLDSTGMAAISATTNWSTMSVNQMTAISPLAIGGLSAGVFALLSSGVIGLLTADQLSGMSKQQFIKIQDPSQLSTAAIAGLTVDQLGSITSWTNFTSAQIEALSGSAISALTPQQLATFGKQQIEGLIYAQIVLMSPNQISALPSTDFGFLSYSALAGLSSQQIAEMSAAQWNAMDAAHLGGLKSSQIGSIPPSVMANLLPIVVGAIALAIDTTTQAGILQLADLNTGQRAKLPHVNVESPFFTADVFKTLTLTQIAGLSPQQIFSVTALSDVSSQLTAAQVQVMSSAQLQKFYNPSQMSAMAVAALTGFQLGGITISGWWNTLDNTFISELNPTVFSQIKATTNGNPISSLTTSALNALSAAQLAQFSDYARSGLPSVTDVIDANFTGANMALRGIAALTAAQIGAATNLSQSLTIDQVKAMSPDQIGALHDPEFLSSGAVGVLTAAQVNAISAYWWVTMPASFVQALLPSTIAGLGMSPDYNHDPIISLLSSAAIAALTAQQIAAMSPTQISLIVPLSGNYLAPSPFANLTITNLSPAQISAITPWQVIRLSAVQISALTAVQISALSINALSGFSIEQIEQLVGNSAVQLDPTILSDYQLASLSDDQRSYLRIGSNGTAAINVTSLPAGGYMALTTLQIAAMSGGVHTGQGGIGLSAGLTDSSGGLVFLQKILPVLSAGQIASLQISAIESAYSISSSTHSTIDLTVLNAGIADSNTTSFAETFFGSTNSADPNVTALVTALNSVAAGSARVLLALSLMEPDGSAIDAADCADLARVYSATMSCFAGSDPNTSIDKSYFSNLFIAQSSSDEKTNLANAVIKLSTTGNFSSFFALFGEGDYMSAIDQIVSNASDQQAIQKALTLAPSSADRIEMLAMFAQSEKTTTGAAALLAGLITITQAQTGVDAADIASGLRELMPAVLASAGSGTLYGLSRNLYKWMGLSRAVFTVYEKSNKATVAGVMAGLKSWTDGDAYAAGTWLGDNIISSANADETVQINADFQNRIAKFGSELSSAIGININEGTDATSREWQALKVQLDEQFGASSLENKAQHGGFDVTEIDSAFNKAFGDGLSSMLENSSSIGENLQATARARNQTLALRTIGSVAGIIGIGQGLGDAINSKDASTSDKLAKASAYLNVFSNLANALDVPLSTVIDDYIKYQKLQQQPRPLTEKDSAALAEGPLANSFKTLKAAFSSLGDVVFKPFVTGSNGTSVAGAIEFPDAIVQTSLDGNTRLVAAKSNLAVINDHYDIVDLIKNKVSESTFSLNEAGAIGTSFKSKALGIGASVLGLTAGVLSIAGAAESKDPTNSDAILAYINGAMGILQNSTTIGSSILEAISGGTDVLRATAGLGLGAQALGVLMGGIQVAKAGVALSTLENDSKSTFEQLSLARAAVADASLQVIAGVVAMGLAEIFPPLALVTLLIPNIQSIVQAVELQNQENTFYAEGLKNDGDAINVLHQIAALSATPIINWFVNAYQPTMLANEENIMTASWYQTAVQQRLDCSIAGVNDTTQQAESTPSQAMAGLAKMLGNINGNSFSMASLVYGNVQTFNYYDAAHTQTIGSVYTTNLKVGDTVGSVNSTSFDANTTDNINQINVTNNANGIYLIERDGSYKTKIDLNLSRSSGNDLVEIATNNIQIEGSSGTTTYVMAQDLTADVKISGGTLGKDTLTFSSALTDSQTIDLDSFTNLYRVIGSANGDVVTGTLDRQFFITGGGSDQINLSGNQDIVSATGSSSVTFSGSSADLYVDFDVNTTGGGGVFHSTQGDGTLDFFPTTNGISVTATGDQATISSTTQSSALSTATGFATVKGSDNGNDVFSFTNTHGSQGSGELQQLQCGNGNDQVNFTDVTGAQLNLGSGGSVVTLNGDSNANLVEQNGAASQTVTINDSSNANLVLRDNGDNINIASQAGKANVWSGANGSSTIQNNGGSLMLFVAPNTSAITVNNTIDVGNLQYVEFDLLNYSHLLIGKTASGNIQLSETSDGNVITGASVTLEGLTDHTYIQCTLDSGTGNKTSSSEQSQSNTYLQVNALIQVMASMTSTSIGAVQIGQQTMYQVSAIENSLLAPH